MPTARTTNARLYKPAAAERNWDVPLNANADFLDAVAAIGRLLVTPADAPGPSPRVRLTRGAFLRQDGTVAEHPGVEAFDLEPSATSCLWLDDDGQLAAGPAFPEGPHVRLARVTTGPAEVVSVIDERICLRSSLAPGGGAVGPSGTLAVVAGSGAPVLVADAVAATVGFFGATPATQAPPISPLQDPSAGTPGDALAPVGSVPIDDNFASIAAKVNALIEALQRHGLMGR